MHGLIVHIVEHHDVRAGRNRGVEERTARQSVLGATVCVGLIGLLAGILPGSVDPADDDPGGVEHVVQRALELIS